jgi:hypothetical protein
MISGNTKDVVLKFFVSNVSFLIGYYGELFETVCTTNHLCAETVRILNVQLLFKLV